MGICVACGHETDWSDAGHCTCRKNNADKSGWCFCRAPKILRIHQEPLPEMCHANGGHYSPTLSRMARALQVASRA